MMKKNRFYGLSLPAFISIILCAVKVTYGYDIVEVATKIVSLWNGIPDISVIKQVDATYPPLAKAARIQGVVVIEVAVDGTGKVTSAKVLSGHPLLKDASLIAARHWEFTPISTGDASEIITGTITFDYILPELREKLEKAILEAENNPDSLDALAVLARAYADNYRNDEAIKKYEEIIRLKPDYNEQIYHNLAAFGNAEKKIEIYREGLNIFPNSITLGRELGGKLSAIGEYSEAIEIYQRALLVEPDNPKLLQDTATNYQKLLRFEESLSFLHRILAIEPDDFTANEEAGFTYFQLGKFDEAERHLKKSISTSTASASAWEFWGDIYQRKGDIDTAVQAWKKALPKSYDASQIERIQAKMEPYLK